MKKTNRGVILIGVIVAMLLSALDQTIIATAIMGVAFVVVLFLPEIPLGRTNLNAVAEAEIKLDAEPGMSEKGEEPKL